MDPTVKKPRTLSHLPLFRFTTIATVIVAMDSLVCVSLWIAGGNSAYMEDSVKDFSFTYSTFDLACFAAVRGVILIACLYYMEHYTLVQISVNKEENQITSWRIAILCRIGVLLVSSISFAYAVIKGGVIVHKIATGTWDSESKADLNMHIAYKILCVIAVVFPLVEIGVGLASWFFMRRLTQVQQLRLIINGESEEEGGKPKKKVDLRRLAILAKPVRLSFTMATKTLHPDSWTWNGSSDI